MCEDSLGSIEDCTGGDSFGGGLYANGDVIIDSSTVHSNNLFGGPVEDTDSSGFQLTAGHGYGAGIYNENTITIRNSTISQNVLFGGDIICPGCSNSQAGDGSGAGLYNNGTMSLIASTIYTNEVHGGVSDDQNGSGFGGGMAAQNVISINNSIVAGNTTSDSGPDLYGTIQSDDYNLIQDLSDCSITGTTTFNIYGLDPQLGLLQDNGGPTWTHTLQFGSPAIDAGSCATSGVSTDQRGILRPIDHPSEPNIDDGCDIGAFELTLPQQGDVVINEVAWSGTAVSPDHEWIELLNRTNCLLDLTNWTLRTQDGSLDIELSNSIPAEGMFLLERGTDSVISDISASLIYSGDTLDDAGEILELVYLGSTIISTANSDGGSWPGGNSSGFYSMERINPDLDDVPANWSTNDGVIRNGLDANSNPINGTPHELNSVFLTSLGDYVWYDANENGIQDGGESGLANIQVNLLDGDLGLIESCVTDLSGLYHFENVHPGEYYLEFVLPTRHWFSPRDQGSDDTLDSDADPTTGQTAIITLLAGMDNNSWDAGMVSSDISLGDYVWIDVNENGIQDLGEIGLENIQVNVLDGSMGLVESCLTDLSGLFSFENLYPGDYYLKFVLPTGYVFSPQDQGSDDTLDSDADPSTGQTAMITLGAGVDDFSWDAGMILIDNTLGNYVWVDADENGIQDSSEIGLANVQVNLLEGSFGLVESCVTDPSGLYLFENVYPGEYYIEFVPPVQYVFSLQDQGSDDLIDSDTDPSTGRTMLIRVINISSVDLSWDAGLIACRSLGNFVWFDGNMNGIQDHGEPGLSGITVNLYDSSQQLLDTTFTDDEGTYLFTDCSDGFYTLEFIAPDCFSFSPPDQGNDDDIDSDVDPQTGLVENIYMDLGVIALTWDAGLYHDFMLTSRTPEQNDLNISPLSDITVQFSDSIYQDTIDAITFLVHGSLSGPIELLYSFPWTDTVTASHWHEFSPGETITVTLTTGISSTSGFSLLVPQIWQFTTETIFIYPPLFSDSGQNLGDDDSRSVALGDVDGDGDLDAFVANYDDANRVWLNDGLGIFTNSYTGWGGYNSQSVALGDVDGDGDLDAFVANYGETNRVYLNDSLGTFTSSGQSLGSWNSRSVILGDVDGDGDLDAFVANYDSPNRVWLNDGLGTFTFSGQILGNSDSRSVVLGDVDGDGDLDAFVANYDDTNRVWLNDGLGTFTDSGQDMGNNFSRSVTLGDMEGDGDLDAFVVFSNSPNRVWFNDDLGTFTDSGQGLGNSDSRSVALGDVDGDGDLDASVANYHQSNRVWLNDGLGTFTDSGQSLGNNRSLSIALGDVDGDGVLDAFVANNGGNKVWLNSSDRSSIGNYVWEDTNKNGLQDFAETGLASISVNLYDAAYQQIATTTTNAIGLYQFTSLVPDDYYVEFLSPTGYLFSPQNQGGSDTLDSDANPFTGFTSVITLGANELDTTWDAGMYPLTSIGDRIWLDVDKDGLQDGSESGFEGVTVNLYTGADSLMDSTLTDSMGNYYFINLSPGNYYLEVVPPAGYVFCLQDQGGNDEFDSDVDPVTGQTAVFAVVEGEKSWAYDAGLSSEQQVPSLSFLSILLLIIGIGALLYYSSFGIDSQLARRKNTKIIT